MLRHEGTNAKTYPDKPVNIKNQKKKSEKKKKTDSAAIFIPGSRPDPPPACVLKTYTSGRPYANIWVSRCQSHLILNSVPIFFKRRTRVIRDIGPLLSTRDDVGIEIQYNGKKMEEWIRALSGHIMPNHNQSHRQV